MSADEIHPDVLRVARLAYDIGGFTARQQKAYWSEEHPELTSSFVSHLNNVGGHSMNNHKVITAPSVYASWLAEALLAPSKPGDKPWTPAQRAVLLALIAEEFL